MTDIWNKFVYKLIECKNRNVEEAIYHNTIEDKLELLGWAAYRGEICHKINLPIGSVGCIQPDILVRKDGENMFVIEVKKPNHNRNERDLQQLFSYMLQLRLKVGVYIGEYIEVFYDQIENNDPPLSILKAELTLENKNGIQFVELFSKEHYSQELIKQQCEKVVQEIANREKLDKIKQDLLSNNEQLTDIVKQYLLTKYASEFSEQAIDNVLDSLIFQVVDKNSKTIENQNTDSHLPSYKTMENVEKKQRIQVFTYEDSEDSKDYTQYSLNGSTPVGKGQFVRLVVSEYVKNHPDLSFYDLEKVFRPEWHSCGVIKRVESVNDPNRYFMKKRSQWLYDSKGTAFVVCNQWGKGHGRESYWDKAKKYFFAIVREQGWKLERFSK